MARLDRAISLRGNSSIGDVPWQGIIRSNRAMPGWTVSVLPVRNYSARKASTAGSDAAGSSSCGM
jgi:hypothetical protein